MSPSFWQLLIVGGLVLLIFGPKRIPEIGKSLGKAIRGFKKGVSVDEEIDVTASENKSDELKEPEKG